MCKTLRYDFVRLSVRLFECYFRLIAHPYDIALVCSCIRVIVRSFVCLFVCIIN